MGLSSSPVQVLGSQLEQAISTRSGPARALAFETTANDQANTPFDGARSLDADQRGLRGEVLA